MALLADLARDFRYSARSLARTPGFTVVAVAVLALGVGRVEVSPANYVHREQRAQAFESITPVAVISEGFWLRRLVGDPAAVDRTITLDGSPHLVVGIVPRDFRFPHIGLGIDPLTALREG